MPAAAAERYLPLLLFLLSLLLISCLDGAVRAAEEGGGLPSSSSSLPGDNGVVASVGDPSATDPTALGRFLSPSALIAGNYKQKDSVYSLSLLQKMEINCNRDSDS